MTTTTNDLSVSIGEVVARLLPDGLPFRFTAYDGSSAGPADAAIGLHLRNERGLSYLLTAPGDLGLARAYVAGDLAVEGVHPGDPYEALAVINSHVRPRLPAPVGRPCTGNWPRWTRRRRHGSSRPMPSASSGPWRCAG